MNIETMIFVIMVLQVGVFFLYLFNSVSVLLMIFTSYRLVRANVKCNQELMDRSQKILDKVDEDLDSDQWRGDS